MRLAYRWCCFRSCINTFSSIVGFTTITILTSSATSVLSFPSFLPLLGRSISKPLHHTASSSKNIMSNGVCNILPSLIVFDLDDCLWSPEMHELYSKPIRPVHGILNPWIDDPSQHVKGTIGMQNNQGDTVKLYDGARRTLYELATNPIYKNVQIAVASTSLEPTYSHACLEGLEVIPGVTLRQMIHYDQIGRSGKLTSRKTTHFHEIHHESGIPYDQMIFFDGMKSKNNNNSDVVM